MVQENEGKNWKGPYKVIDHEDSIVHIMKEGSEREVNRARVAKHYDWTGIFEEEEEEVKSILKENNEEKEKEEEKTNRQTRSETRKVRIEEILNIKHEKKKERFL